MVSPQRIKEKIHRMESKIMDYHDILESGVIPAASDNLHFKEGRLGKPLRDIERVRARQAMFDLKTDIGRNLAKLDLSEADWLKEYHMVVKDGKKAPDDFTAVYNEIGKEAEK